MAAASYRALLDLGMESLVQGTATAMDQLFRHRDGPFLGRMNNWTGRHAWSDGLVTHDPGFLLGRLFLLYRYTGDARYLAWALDALEPMVPGLTREPLVNVMAGCEVYYGLCWAADVTGEARWRNAALAGVENLVRSCWVEAAGQFFILPGSGSQAVDTAGFLLGLPWAGRNEPRFLDYWRRHHDAVLALRMVRADGSSFHQAQLDAEHRFHYYTTAQGLLPTSTWSRGQAWAMHGFTAAYESTGEPRYLEAARALAGWWVDHTAGDPVLIYDRMDEEGPRRPRDSCAAAMAATALARLAQLDPERAAGYRPAVEATVRELVEWYLSPGGVLLHGSWGFRRETVTPGIPGRRLRFPQEDVMPYGNYFITELLYRELTDDWSAFALG